MSAATAPLADAAAARCDLTAARPRPRALSYAEGVALLSSARFNLTHGWELRGRPSEVIPAADAMQSKQPWSLFQWVRKDDWTFVGAAVRRDRAVRAWAAPLRPASSRHAHPPPPAIPFAQLDQGFFFHMYRVRRAWPFGIDLCCLAPEEEEAAAPGARNGSGAPARRQGAARRDTYALLHFFNKPFRSTLCPSGPANRRGGRDQYYVKARAYHADAAAALRDDAGASDAALVPPELQGARCLAHSLAEEACARVQVSRLQNPKLASQVDMPLSRAYNPITPFRSCRLSAKGARARRHGAVPYCPEDAAEPRGRRNSSRRALLSGRRR